MRLNFAPFYADPKSCAAYREVRDEALTGELAGIPSPRVQEWERRRADRRARRIPSQMGPGSCLRSNGEVDRGSMIEVCTRNVQHEEYRTEG